MYWRRYASGFRGEDIAALGGVRDASCLSLTQRRASEDQVFRDATQHFLRRFDRATSAFVPMADDDELEAFSDTRSARAFMLLGDATGLFEPH